MRARLSALVLVPLATALVTLGLADTHAQQPKPTDQPSVIAQETQCLFEEQQIKVEAP